MNAPLTTQKVIAGNVFLGNFCGFEIFTSTGLEALEPLEPMRYVCPEHTPGTHMVIWTLSRGTETQFFRLDIRRVEGNTTTVTSPARQIIGPYDVHFIHGGGKLDIGRVEYATHVIVDFDRGKYIVTYYPGTGVLQIQVSNVGTIYMVPSS